MARGLRIGSKTEVLKNLRALLRVARARSSQDTVRDCKFSQQILAQYRTRQHETDRTKMRTYRAEASDYLMMLGGVEEQRRLWALDAGMEKKLSGKEIVDRSARLVGLQVPQTYAEKEDEELKRKAEAAAKYLAEKRAKEKASAATGS